MRSLFPKFSFAITLSMGLLLSANGFAKQDKKAPATPKKATSTSKIVTVVIETNMGKMEAELNREKAPISVKNFLNYVDSNFYAGTIFHRVIKGFMIQGGGFKPGMNQKKTLDPIKNEADNGLKNDRGTLAMARTNVVDSATSQFFINHKDNAFLNHRSKDARGWGYAVFGKVTKGLDVLDKIAGVKTGRSGPHGDVPTKDVVITKVSRK